jgi:hypothetical protein
LRWAVGDISRPARRKVNQMGLLARLLAPKAVAYAHRDLPGGI